MAKYEPSGRVGVPGLLIVLAIGLGSGAVAGTVFHFVGRFFYLVILFPFLWGVGVGAATAAAVRMGKCRNAIVGAAAGILAAVASYGLFQALDNARHKSLFREAVISKIQKHEDFDRLYDEGLKENYGGTGFLAQLAMRAEAGMNISRSSSSRNKDKKPMISGTGMYVYWAVELAIIAGVGLFLPLAAAREPFCERCEAWYEKADVAGIAGPKVDEARRALAAKAYAGITACVSADRSDGVISMEKCPRRCDGAVRVKLDSVAKDKKGKESRSTVFEEMVASPDAKAIESAAAGPAVPPPAGFTGAGPAAI